jgi:UDP-2-acetamido-2-deoxy-ribo-hexuluronate aminotransferase
MGKIQMVDLYSQYQKSKTEIDEAIQNVIQSSAFINGPQVREFRNDLKNYLGCKHVIACANGTDALQIALMSLKLAPGDEVIVPDFTFIATAEVISLLKLKPVFVDVDPDTFLMDLTQVKQKISSKTKVIIPVHIFGQCVDNRTYWMHQLFPIKEFRLFW